MTTGLLLQDHTEVETLLFVPDSSLCDLHRLHADLGLKLLAKPRRSKAEDSKNKANLYTMVTMPY